MPITGWHSARLQSPGKFDAKAWKTTAGGSLYGGKVKIPASINIIWGKLKGKAKPTDPPIAQALRFPMDKYTVASAKAFLKANKVKFMSFEAGAAATKKESKVRVKNILEAFMSLKKELEKAVSYKFGRDAYVSDFSNKEVIIGFEKSDITPISSWESGEFTKASYKLGKNKIVITDNGTKVSRITDYKEAVEVDATALQEMASMDKAFRNQDQRLKAFKTTVKKIRG